MKSAIALKHRSRLSLPVLIPVAMLLLSSTPLWVGVAYSATFTVTNTNDSGAGSLQQAITDANARTGKDTIVFNISGVGPHKIRPSSTLPTITSPVMIDSYTQPGASPNTNPTGSGINAVLKIELDGRFVAGDGLYITAGNSTVRGLVINLFAGNGIRLETNGSNVIEGNFIGTNVAGTVAAGNLDRGVFIQSGSNTIGGTTPAARNLISGNDRWGMEIRSGSANYVLGNLVGTDVTGTADLGNGGPGVEIFASSNNVISR